jgi:hypothetical protein
MDSKEKTAFILLLDRNDGIIDSLRIVESKDLLSLRKIVMNTALRPFDGPQGPQAQGPAKAKVVEPVETPTES